MKKKVLLVSMGLLLLLATGAFMLLSLTHYPADAEVLAWLKEDPAAGLGNDRLEFWPPAGMEAKTGLIIYPGGNVDFKAYAPVAAAISREGYYTVVVRMPLNLAVLGINRGAGIMAANPGIDRWVVAGHSLGGAMAARFALGNRTALEGLILWAAYPDKDLTQSGLKVLSHYATRDGIINEERFQETKAYLPPDTLHLPITGGNHAYYGSYGFQRGDLEAEISRQEQQRQIIEAALAFLESLEGGR